MHLSDLYLQNMEILYVNPSTQQHQITKTACSHRNQYHCHSPQLHKKEESYYEA